MIGEVKIFEQEIGTKPHAGKFTILFGGVNSSNPKAYMDEIVDEYVGTKSYTQFVDIQLDNPWLRIIVSGINDLSFKTYTHQHL